MRDTRLKHKFVEYIPDELSDGTIYISMAFATVVHKCCCGCGAEVVTPLSPTDWKLTFDGEAVSLFPSIGNWSFPCQSHYWIERNGVKWAATWSQEEIAAGRAFDSRAKAERLEGGDVVDETTEEPATQDRVQVNTGVLQRLVKWVRGR